MAGTFTHWMIAEEALGRYGKLPDKHPLYFKILAKHAFVAQGAIGPDYPYLTEVAGNLLRIHSWADRMHYESTGDFVAKGVRNLAAVPAEHRDVCAAWLCGFATHVVADALVHPVVNLAVSGLPLWNGAAHRRCEMTQDSWIYHAITNLEIGEGGYVERLKACSDPGDAHHIHPAIRAFWTQTLRDAHPAAANHFGDIDPDTWHRNVVFAFTQAARPIPIFRHVGEEQGLVYKRSTELAPDDRRVFVEQVKLPGGRVGHFKPEVFDRTVERVVDVWGRLFADVDRGSAENVPSYLRNWDLDRGVDLDALALWA